MRSLLPLLACCAAHLLTSGIAPAARAGAAVARRGACAAAAQELHERLRPAEEAYERDTGDCLRPSSTIRAPLFAARTLSAAGQSRVTLSLRYEHC